MRNELENRRIPYFGNYVLFQEIGRGGMGVVYDAQETNLDRPVALKILHPSVVATEAATQRLRVEAETAARLQHPNIVPIYEVGEHEGQPYLAMHLVDGESLADRLARPGPLMPAREAAALLAKIARAVHHAHERGVLHRDLKPANILLDKQGEPHLIDFGLAKCLEEDLGLTRTGAFLGTPAFASPEQASCNPRLVTTASDIYSLGAILYAVLTGCEPFAGNTPSDILEQVKNRPPPAPKSLRTDLPADLEIICLKCLEKEPAHRYASAISMAEDLDRFLSGYPIAARRFWPHERLWLWVKRKPLHVALGLTVGLSLAALGVVAWQYRAAETRQKENKRLIELGSAITLALTQNPRQMGWVDDFSQSLARAELGTQSAYHRDQFALTLEGWDASLLAFDRLQLTNPAALSVGVRDTNMPATKTAAARFSPGETSLTNAPQVYPVPIRRMACPNGIPIEVVETASGEVRARVGHRFIELASLEGVPPTIDSIRLGSVSEQTNVLALALSGPGQRDILTAWRLADGHHLGKLPIAIESTVLALSPDGLVVAWGNRGGEAQLWEIPSGRTTPPVSLSKLPLASLALAPNPHRVSGQPAQLPGWILAAGDVGGTIHVYDTAASRIQVICRGGHYQVSVVAFSPDGMLLASGGRVPVRLWDAATGAPILYLRSPDYCETLRFSADGSEIEGRFQDRDLGRCRSHWALQNGRGVAELRGLSSSITHVVFSPQADRLAAVSHGWEIGVWDLEAPGLVHVFQAPQGVTADNCALAFSPDGRRLACAAGEEGVLWDLGTGGRIESWRFPGGVADALAFPADDALYLLRVETQQATEWPTSEHSWSEFPRVCRLRNLLASDPRRVVREVPEFNRGVRGIYASPDGRLFAIDGVGETKEGTSRKILAISVPTGTNVWEVDLAVNAPARPLLFFPTGSELSFTTNGLHWQSKDLSGRRNESQPHPPEALAIGPHGFWVKQVDERSTVGRGVALFEDNALRVNLGLHSASAQFPRFDPSGRWLAWGNAAGVVSLCDLDEIRCQFARAGLGWQPATHDSRN